MIIKTFLVTALLAASPIALANDASVSNTVLQCGLSERNVRMILGARKP